ncbi:hypothetical protein NLI96_g1898 [Meripilus lineatus]|uniref:Protein kinase domain-containing protein n=1 Tax=Meripilus lineatus TaxID=2056292 RepID=A0AAD5V9K8_9APHY|nr:hypothetical protein NLI96_g1898 [Physisporinus lineatus]
MRSLLPRKRERSAWETSRHTKFLDEVWKVCSSRPEGYRSIVSLLHTCVSHGNLSFETLVVGIQYLVDALADHPDLMMKVLSFLPRECTFRLSSDFDKTRTVYITTPMGTVPRAAFGMIHKDGIHPEPPIVDQLITRLISSALFTVETKVSQETLVSLKGGDATRALQIMNELVESGTKWTQFVARYNVADKRERTFRLLCKLAVASQKFPPTLHIRNIHLPRFAIASGGVGEIFQSTWKGSPIAIKAIRKTSSPEYLQELRKEFFYEALNWWHCRHEYVLPLLGVFPSDVSFVGFCLVLPWMQRGDIRKCAHNLKQQGFQPPLDRWLYELANGLEFLHGKKVVHGDLRACNVLITDDRQPKVQLTDFGLSVFASRMNTSSLHIHGGNTRWMAPEQLRSQGARADPSMDVYSFASLCIEVYTNASPFREMPRNQPDLQIARAILEGVRPMRPIAMGDCIPDDLWALMEHCWSHVPADRPTASVLQVRLKSRLRTA